MCSLESCHKTFEYHSHLVRHEGTHSSNSIRTNVLKAALVDAEEQIYLVLSAVKGY